MDFLVPSAPRQMQDLILQVVHLIPFSADYFVQTVIILLMIIGAHRISCYC